VGVTGGQDQPRVVGEAWREQACQQVVGEVVDPEGGLETIGRAPVQVPGLGAGVEDQRVDGSPAESACHRCGELADAIE
jgi:hypothetical protein